MPDRIEGAKTERVLRETDCLIVTSSPGVDHRSDCLSMSRTRVLSQGMLDHLNCCFIVSSGSGVGVQFLTRRDFWIGSIASV